MGRTSGRVVQVAGLLAGLLLTTANGEAQLQRRFVSAQNGLDSNDCSAGAPCRTFARAMQMTSTGGEVVVADSGGYGPFTITKSIHVTAAPGVYAGITVFSGNGVTVNAPGDSEVSLSNLHLQGLGGSTGIHATVFQTLRISNCIIQGFSDDGILASTTGDAVFYLDNTKITDCSNRALELNNVTASRMRAFVEGCKFDQCAHGIGVLGNTKLVVRDSFFRLNSTGLFGDGLTNRTDIHNCTFSENSIALVPGGVDGDDNSIFQVSRCYINGNTAGLDSTNGDDLRSLGDNRVTGNNTNGTFTSTAVTQ